MLHQGPLKRSQARLGCFNRRSFATQFQHQLALTIDFCSGLGKEALRLLEFRCVDCRRHG